MIYLPIVLRRISRILFILLCVLGLTAPVSAISLKSILIVSGSAIDKTPLSGKRGGANINRLGGFGSDLFYDRKANVFYGLVDRGPGGGTIPYSTRVQKFTLDINPATGEAKNFKLLDTIVFRMGPAPFNGLDPKGGNLGLSHDPEGFVVAPNGHFYVSDEYGPSVYEFMPDGMFVRAFRPPDNIVPRDAAGVNFSASSSVMVVRGRQRNRGFEGLAISPDGTKVFGLLQDPLADEGSVDPACTMACAPAGRFSRNIRMIAYNTATGESTAQYIYQLENLADVNARVPSNRFGSNAQGVNIGISALTAISDHEFLALERDNR
jgi:hypothetical protein